MSPIVNLQLVVKCKKRSFHSFKVEVALLRYIVFSFESGCDTSEPHVSYISRACSSLVRQPYYAPNCIILKISGLVVVLTVRKVHWAGRAFYMDEYTLIFLFSQCIRCAQKRYCWESVRFASERSRVRIPPGPPYCANPSLIFFVKHCFGFVFVFRGCGSVRILFFRCIRYSLARLSLSDVCFLTGRIDICCANGYN